MQKQISREFYKYISLNVLGMLGLSCYILADTFFISKRLGADGLTALNLAISVYSIINGLGLMLGIGGATRFAICRAQNETQKGNQVFRFGGSGYHRGTGAAACGCCRFRCCGKGPGS